MSDKRLISRMEWASYMNIGTEDVPVWSRIGEGFTDLKETKKAIEYGRQYVNEKSERRDVVGYAPTISYSCDMHSGDPVIERIARVHDLELVGTDAQVEVLSVNLYEKAEDGKCKAYKRRWSIIPDEKGEGVEALILTGAFAGAGDIVQGVFDVEAGEFQKEETE